MTYLPIILMLLDKVTCLTSALFLLLSSFISLFVYFLEQTGGCQGGVGWGRVGTMGGAGLSAVHTYFFSAKDDTHSPSCRE